MEEIFIGDGRKDKRRGWGKQSTLPSQASSHAMGNHSHYNPQCLWALIEWETNSRAHCDFCNTETDCLWRLKSYRNVPRRDEMLKERKDKHVEKGWGEERDETKSRNNFFCNNCRINTWVANTHAPWHVTWETSKTVNTRKVRMLDPNSWYSQADSSWHI